jgi:hypothetical protein
MSGRSNCARFFLQVAGWFCNIQQTYKLAADFVPGFRLVGYKQSESCIYE